MIINLMKSTRMFSVTLPQKVKGQYWVTDLDANGEARDLIRVEADNNQWVLISNKTASIIVQDVGAVDRVVLTDTTILRIKVKDSDERIILFTEAADQTNQILAKIKITQSDILAIGSSEENNLIFNNQFVSANHAQLSYNSDGWAIQDLESKNGTYVNGYRATAKTLKPGDMIYIMGLKIVIGGDFIAVNNPGEKLKIKANSLQLYKPLPIEPREIDIPPEDNYFSRSPRFHREIETAEIIIDPPPAPQKIDTVPLALMLGPSLTMGMTSVSTGVLTLMNVTSNGGNIRQALPTLIMSVSMLLGTVLWPILTKRYEKKQKIKAEKERQEKYLAYLSEQKDRIRKITKEQGVILCDNLISEEECKRRIEESSDNLWERVIGQTDFLRVRVGLGTVPAALNLKYPEKHFTLEDDTLQNAMLSLADEPKDLKHVPISFSLAECIAAGIYGEKEDTERMLKAVILQLITLHSYDELKLMLITDEADEKTWSFVKFIPHFWNNEKTVRFFATTQDDTKDLTAVVEQEIMARAGDRQQSSQQMAPYYVLIVTSRMLARKFEGLQMILKHPENLGCSILYIHEKISDFPKETSKVINACGNASKIFDKDDTSGTQITFTADTVDYIPFDRLSAKIANINLDIASKNYKMPSMLTFLEMFNVGKVEHLNSLTRWKENNPVKTLQTPVGVDTFGDLFTLDLHEKYHGPHGLVAGMTGSGKSEFLITFILSLAVNYHPDEVAFILIDYKGGGLAGAFENKEKGIKLPHLAGVITNLDGAAQKRTLVSFQSERRRREDILNKARKIANEGTMDIYKYQQLYRDKVVDKPLPHLFIIADEFAELKAQQSDFMEQLVSLARVGRSLGIHLILATQKPSGVVDEQIWSNSKFRVCLKVQERADSQEMIKRPDAAELSQTGRFYLQVGFNELFAMGQSAWCGADYIPKDTAEKEADNSIQIVDNLGRTVMNVWPPRKEIGTGSMKQIVAIVNYLSALAAEEQIEILPLWRDPIPGVIFIASLESEYNYTTSQYVLNPIVGLYDDPSNQKQDLLTVPFSNNGNCLVYGATGNGKTTFITAICFSLIRHHSPDEVNLYIMDFGAETMKAFEFAPQVGDVVTATESEKIANLFKMLRQELESRKIIFSETGGDYRSYIRSALNEKQKTVPNIVVILNNYSAFVEQYEDYQDEFTILSRDGSKYGIYFVVTAGSTNAVRYKTQQNFKMMFTMQLNDPTDYSIIVGKNDGLLPAEFKGRGLVALDRVYEFQTAYCTDAEDKLEYIRQYCKELARSYKAKAKRIPVLPDVVNYYYVAPMVGNCTSVPVGVNRETLEIATVNISAAVLYPILTQDLDEAVSFTVAFQKVCEGTCATKVLDPDKLLPWSDTIVPTDAYDEFVVKLFDAMVERNNAYKDANLDVSVLKDRAEHIILIFGIKKFVEMLSPDRKDKFLTLIDKADPCYKIHIIAVESEKRFKDLCFDIRVKNKAPGTEGLWIGDGITEQSSLRLSKYTNDLYKEIGSNNGYIVLRSRPRLMKLLSSGEVETNG